MGHDKKQDCKMQYAVVSDYLNCANSVVEDANNIAYCPSLDIVFANDTQSPFGVILKV